MDILRAKYGPSQCFRCQGFFIPADTVHALLDASSVQVNTFQRTVESPSIKNQNAAFAKESTPQISWVVLKTPKNRVEKTKNTNNGTIQPTKIIDNSPAPPKIYFWEQRVKNATQRQQTNPNSSKKSSQATSLTDHNIGSANDIFDQLNTPAVRETFDFLEEFIQIATTILTKYGRLRAVKNLLRDEINI
ncbi:hypothetical protein TNCV_338051 [Trichonephila clavipes]|nr:hypothetical protein TNCV_338051 [Trichonephila clavipes]